MHKSGFADTRIIIVIVIILLFLHLLSCAHPPFAHSTPTGGERSRAEGREAGREGGSERVREGAALDNTIPQIYSIPSVPQVSLY